MEILKLNEIDKFYGKNHALKSISFSVNKGEVVGTQNYYFYMLIQS